MWKVIIVIVIGIAFIIGFLDRVIAIWSALSGGFLNRATAIWILSIPSLLVASVVLGIVYYAGFPNSAIVVVIASALGFIVGVISYGFPIVAGFWVIFKRARKGMQKRKQKKEGNEETAW